MKKITAFLVLLLLLLTVLPLTASAAAPTAALAGPSVVRAGDEITVTFSINGTGIQGVQGAIDFNANQLELKSVNGKTSWIFQYAADKDTFVSYFDSASNTINKKTDLFTVAFKVKNLDPGTAVTVTVKDIIASCSGENGSQVEEFNVANATYTINIAPPKSANADLGSLLVVNGTLVPEFSKNTLEYTVTVPHTVEKLELAYTTDDPKATASDNNPILKINATTTVTITVKAENGSTQTYTLRVTRLQDPNYEPSANANLTELKVEGFLISPVFKPDVTEYVVWLPYETTSLTVLATPEDENATVQVSGGDILVAGQDNPIIVTCIAENGSEKRYTVIAKRAAAHGSSDTTAPVTEETTAPPETTAPVTTAPPTTTEPPKEKQGGVPGLLTFFLSIVTLAIGFICGFYYRIHYVTKKRQRRIQRPR